MIRGAWWAPLMMLIGIGCRPAPANTEPLGPPAGHTQGLWMAPKPGAATVGPARPPLTASTAGWIEAPRRVFDPLQSPQILAVGSETALLSTGIGPMALSRAAGVVRLRLPLGWFWLGLGAGDVLYAATTEGALYRSADAMQAADATWTPTALIEAAATWDASASFVVAARGGEVLVSQDHGSSYRRRRISPTLTIRRVRARHDGVIVAWGHDLAGPTTYVSSDGGQRWELSQFQPFEIDRIGGVITNRGDRCPAMLSADGRLWLHGRVDAAQQADVWLRMLRLSPIPLAPTDSSGLSAQSPTAPIGGMPVQGHEASCEPPAPQANPTVLTTSPTERGCRGVNCVRNTVGRRVDSPSQFGLLMNNPAVVDRANGDVVLATLPPGCVVKSLRPLRGSGLLVCELSANNIALHTMARDGRFYREAAFRWPAAAIGEIESGQDGTVVIACRSPACAGKALVRSPNPLGDDRAWREISVPDVVTYRPLLLGAALALTSPASADTGERGRFGSLTTSDLLGGEGQGVSQAEAEQLLHTLSLTIARNDGSHHTVTTHQRFEGDLVSLEVGDGNIYLVTSVEVEGRKRRTVLKVEDGILRPQAQSPAALAPRPPQRDRLPAHQYNPYGIAIDHSHVYWTDPRIGAVQRVAKGGGKVTTLAKEQRGAFALAIDDSHVYFTIRGSANVADGSVRRVPKQGGPVEQIAGGQLRPEAIVSDDLAVYWASRGYDGALDGAVLRWNKQGGEPQALATGIPSPSGIALDQNHVYFTSTGQISRITKRGGPRERIAVELLRPRGLTVADGHLVWTDPQAGTISSAPLATLSQVTTLRGLASPVGITVCSGAIFATLIDAGQLLRASKPLASELPQPNAVTCDQHNAYVSLLGGRRISAVPLNGGNPRSLVGPAGRQPPLRFPR